MKITRQNTVSDIDAVHRKLDERYTGLPSDPDKAYEIADDFDWRGIISILIHKIDRSNSVLGSVEYQDENIVISDCSAVEINEIRNYIKPCAGKTEDEILDEVGDFYDSVIDDYDADIDAENPVVYSP